jgi:hydroxyacylglutathione hydrolase
MKSESVPLIRRFEDSGLGNSSYLIGSRRFHVGAVVDPSRDASRYVSAASRLGLRISDVLETHLHADFLSGAREIAAATGARISASAEARLEFEHERLNEGDLISVGDLKFTVLATPGHTPEHISFVLPDPRAGRPQAVFSGGALIPGGAARTDLLRPDLTDPLARDLFRTIHEKLLAMPDRTRVYPTHGAGSFCVASTATQRTTTIGKERRRNPLALSRTEDEFVRMALSGLPSYPPYFLKLRPVNQHGPRVLGSLPSLRPIFPDQVRGLAAQGVSVLDIRPAQAFAAAHLVGSYGIDLALGLVPWAGWLIPFGTPLILIADGAHARREALRQLLRIGYDDVRGYLAGGLLAAQEAGLPIESFPRISVQELHDRLKSPDSPLVLDVRFGAEWDAGHIPGATHIELGRLASDDLPLPRDRVIAAHCVHGARTAAGLSLLAQRDYTKLAYVEGGIQAWSAAGFPVESVESDVRI